MTDVEIFAKELSAKMERAVDHVEATGRADAENGDLIISDRFSRGYLLGYAHALMGAYDALPDWLRR